MTTPTRSVTPAPPDTLVVMGASSGGVQALLNLLPALPADFAPAIVVVLHIPADAPARLAELFGSRCRLPVAQAEDKMPLAPGTILFAPPGYHTQIESDGSIALSVDPPEHFSRPSIDVLFESAAWAWRERCLGVLLTGANADGAAGLAAIHDAGGRTWVQDPISAQAQEMPRSALALGTPADVLSLRAIAERLGRMTRQHPTDFPSSPSGHSPT